MSNCWSVFPGTIQITDSQCRHHSVYDFSLRMDRLIWPYFKRTLCQHFMKRFLNILLKRFFLVTFFSCFFQFLSSISSTNLIPIIYISCKYQRPQVYPVSRLTRSQWVLKNWDLRVHPEASASHLLSERTSVCRQWHDRKEVWRQIKYLSQHYAARYEKDCLFQAAILKTAGELLSSCGATLASAPNATWLCC